MVNRNKGFTLIEILIALFIFTIIAVMMTSALHSLFVTQSATEQRAEQFAELQTALLLISRDLEQAINRPITNAKNIIEAPLLGTARSVTFTHAGLVNPLGQLQRSTLQRERLAWDKEYLTRDTWQALDQTASSEPDTRVLLKSIRDARFEYLNDKNQFQKDWPPPSQTTIGLPRAIRFSMTFNNGTSLSQTYLIPGSARAKPP